MKRTIKELLDEKVSIVEEKLGKTPFEALGVSEEQYMKMKDSSKLPDYVNAFASMV